MNIYLIHTLVFVVFSLVKGTVYDDLNVSNMCLNGFCVPRVVWTYWDKNIPEDVEEMVNVTRNSLVNYFNFCFLTNENVTDFLDSKSFPDKFRLLNPRHKSEIIRLSLVEKYGGVYIDASTYITSGSEMEVFVFKGLESRKEIFSFMWNEHISPCFFGAPKQSLLVRLWKNAFEVGLKSVSLDDYVDRIAAELDLVEMLRKCGPYCFVDFAYWKIVQDYPRFREMELLLPLDHRSHLRLHIECGYDPACIKRRLLHDPAVRKYPFIKVGHKERLGRKINFYEAPKPVDSPEL